MQPGFLLDMTYGKMAQSSWVEGLPKRSFLRGLDLKGQQQLPVSTFRCTRCGYLESYTSQGGG